MAKVKILCGDALTLLRQMEPESVSLVVTSPPFWSLRAYGTPPQTWDDGWCGELGGEPDPDMFVSHLADVFDEVKRVLRSDGVCFVNIGSSYASKPQVVEMELRDDLTEEEKAYVLSELAKCSNL